MGLKFSNTIGAPFRSFVTDQLTLRAGKATQQTRTLEDVLYLANKNAWVRLQSSVVIDENYYKLLKGYFDQREPGTNYAVVLPNQGSTTTEAARNWILQAGTSKIAANGSDVSLRYGLGPDGAYGLGGTMDMGYRPMPGLDSVTIETAGKQGSLRYATINFKAWNMTQLDIIDALYFRLGFTMLLEWGHVEYLTNNTVLQRDVTGISNFFEDKITKENIQFQINKKVRDSCGNYDGMLGTVSNFTYSMNQDGGWDCSIKLVGLGTLLDTQRINSSYSMPETMAKQFKSLRKEFNAELQKQIQDLTNSVNAGRIKEAEGKFGDKQAKYDKDHPLNNVKDYYQFELTRDRTTNVGETLEYTNSSKITKLLGATLLTPTIPATYVPGTYRDNLVVNPVSVNDSVAQTAFQTNGTGTNSVNLLYFPWITSTANYAGSLAGWKYPVTVGSTYRVRTDIGDFLTTSKTNGRRLRTTPGDVIKFTKVTSNNTARVTIKEFADGWQASRRPLPAFTNRMGVPGFTITYGSTFTATTGVPLVLLPPTTPPQTSTTLFTPGAGIAASTTTTVDQDLSALVADDFILDLYLNSYVATSITTLDLNKTYIDNKSLLDRLTSYVTQILGPSSNEEERTWVVSDLGKPEPFSKKATFSSGHDAGNTSYLTGFKLKKDITIPDVEYYDSAGAVLGKVNIILTLEINTEVPYILSELVAPAAGEEVPTYGAPELEKYKSPPKTEASEDDGLRSCSSALESILLLIQYTAIVREKKNFKFSTDKLTGQILAGIKGAPLNKLFTASGSLRTNYKSDTKSPSEQFYYTDPYYLGLKGYNTALMSDQVINSADPANPTDAYNEVKTVEFEKLMQAYILNKEYKNTESGLGITTELRPVYVPFGYLLFFISNICLLFDSTKPSDGTGNAPARPFFYIDFNPKTNFCLTTPYQLSTNPEVCLIPYSGKNEDYNNIFRRNGINPTAPNTFPSGLYQPEGSAISSKIKVDHSYATGTDAQGRYRGRTMDILLNTQYLLNVLRDLVQRDGSSDVYFRPFINRVIEDVNKSLGGINAFRLAYVDESNTAAIVDDQFVPPPSGEPSLMRATDAARLAAATQTSKGTAIIPIFDKMSNVRTLEFQTNISSRMSSIVAIGARATNDGAGGNANGSAQASDGSPFSWLSRGLKDRIIQEAEDISNVTGSNASTGNTTTKKNNAAIAETFNVYIRSIYGSTADNKIDRAGADPMTNYYMQATVKQKAIDPLTSGAPIIPLNASFSTDGISGMNMGNVFLLPEKNLPISLRSADGITPRFGYMIMGLNHQIQSNQWVTNVRGQIIRLRPEESYLGSTFNPSGIPNISNAPRDPDLRVGLPQPAGKFTVPGDNVKFDVGNFAGKQAGYITSNTPQTPKGTPMSTANFGKNSVNKKYYPTFEFKGFTDHTSDIQVTSPLTEAEIVDKTEFNPFNFGLLGGGTGKATSFIVHHTGGTSDTIQVFLARGVNAQYIIDPAGVIYRYVPDGLKASQTENSNTTFGKSYKGGQITNSNAVGVEIMADDDFGVTEAQVEACLRLINYCGFNADEVVGHGEVNSIKDCWEGYLITTRARNSAANWNLASSSCGKTSTRRLKR